jgi:hypothetical protein
MLAYTTFIVEFLGLDNVYLWVFQRCSKLEEYTFEIFEKLASVCLAKLYVRKTILLRVLARENAIHQLNFPILIVYLHSLTFK